MKLPILNKLFKKNTMKRTTRLNSLLKEVISEVIKKDVGNPNISKLTTITKVEITKDLHQAKVFISIIGTPEEKTKTLKALESASSFISIKASKKVVMKYFPSLIFKLDTSLEKQFRIEKILQELKQKESNLSSNDDK